MEFTLSIITTEEIVSHKNFVIHNLSRSMNIFFKEKKYGNGLLHFNIGFMIVKSRIGYEEWNKIKKPKFIDFKVVKSKLTGLENEIHKTFRYEIKLSDETIDQFTNAGEADGAKLITRVIKNNLQSLQNSLKKISDFNYSAFIEDLEIYFQVQ